MSLRRSLLAVAVLLGSSLSLGARESISLVSDYALSPDGQRLVFVWVGDLWTVDSRGGEATRLTVNDAEDYAPCFSPDGSEIAFVSTRNEGRQLFTMPVEGGTPTQHTFHSEGVYLEEYGPKGDAFLVRAVRDHFWRDPSRFFRVERGGKTADQLLFDAAGADGRLSPDGKSLLFSREGTNWFRKGYEGSQASQIWLYELETGTFREVLADDLGFRHPRWKPDGSGFYYTGRQSGSFNLWECDIDGTDRRQLTDFDDDSVHRPEVSRNGEVIVFSQLFDLYRFEPGSGRPPRRIEIYQDGEPLAPELVRRNLTSADEVAFTDDGLEIAFVAGGDVWVMDTELREPRRITSTPEEERDPVFSADGEQLYFVSDADGQCDIWRAERKRSDSYWWQNEEFRLERWTRDPAVESNLECVPNAKQLAFVRGRGDLVLRNIEDGAEQTLLTSWNAPDYTFSPDGKWVAYAVDDNDFNRDIWIEPIDGSRPPFNLSVHPDNDRGPSWSPDGRKLAWTGRRADDETDIYYVYLRSEDDEEDSRDRRLEKALEKMKKGRKPAKGAKPKGDDARPDAASKKDGAPSAKQEPAKDNSAKSDESKNDDAEEKKDEKKEDAASGTVIDFEGIHERIRQISISDSWESSLLWIEDDKLVFDATINGDSGSYSVEFPDQLSPKKFSSTRVRGAAVLKGAKSLGLVNRGQPALLSFAAKLQSFAFTAHQAIDPRTRYRIGFDQAWRAMRDGFYDDRLGNRNWDAIRAKYGTAAEDAIDDDAFARVVQLMLGELNGSHLGFSNRGGPRGGRDDQQWTEVTAHLGLRFDREYLGPGWKVRDVVLGGPTSEVDSRVEPGEIVLAVDGVSVDPSLPVHRVLNGLPDRDIQLRVRSTSGDERDVTLRPTSYGEIRRLLYDEWVTHNERRVEELSEGRLGYLHIRGMNWSSFLKFELELYRVGHGKDGLVIDVRANGGGSTADHLLTALTQPRHAITVPRGGGPGYPQDRRVYASWTKPIVVLCDQDSFSNAEIFAHAIKTLGRGKLVGQPTAGGVISTGGARILDLGFLRMPFRGWFLLDGEDMELNGAMPDVRVEREPGDWPAGRDPQLATAVSVLLEDVATWKARPEPVLRKASERRDVPVREVRRARF
ncbi:MAG: PD40 domain-containing protein [Planctomycetes bacterium]|nr:PD40 domain-containing protein [Planctomycetota bacterium]